MIVTGGSGQKGRDGKELSRFNINAAAISSDFRRRASHAALFTDAISGQRRDEFCWDVNDGKVNGGYEIMADGATEDGEDDDTMEDNEDELFEEELEKEDEDELFEEDDEDEEADRETHPTCDEMKS